MTKRILAAIAGATALTAAPAIGADNGYFQPSTFSSLNDVFDAADLDDDGDLSRAEYRAMRLNTVDEAWVGRYAGDLHRRLSGVADESFAALDSDENLEVSRIEFQNAAHEAQAGADNYVAAWDWDPEYMSLAYYLSANRIDTGELQGDAVTNLDGERVGTIEGVIRHNDNDRYYAVVDVVGTDMSHTPAIRPAERVGIPLNDILFYEDDRSLMLSTRGTDYLRNAESVELDFTETVDYVDHVTLYG